MWKKKRACMLVVPMGSVDTAVLDIKVTAKSKMMLQHYTCLGLVTFPQENISLALVCPLQYFVCECTLGVPFLQRHPRLCVVVQKGTFFQPDA